MHLRERVLLPFLVSGTLLLMMLAVSAAAPVHAVPNAPSQNAVTVTVDLIPTYDVTGSSTAAIKAEIDVNSSVPSGGTTLTIQSTFSSTINGTATLTDGTSENLTSRGVPGSVNTNMVVIPPNTVSFAITANGTESGANFLWRYITGVPEIAVTGGGFFLPTTIYFVVPSGNVVSQVYAYGGGTLPLGDATEIGGSVPGHVTYRISGGAGLLILQSSAYLPASIAITVCAIAIVGLAALNLFAFGRDFFDKTLGGLRTGLGKLSSRARLPGSGKDFSFRKLFQPKKLLALFILCGIVMVAVGALGGPDPQVKAYVIAGNQNSVNSIQQQLQHVAGSVQVVTPSEDYSDFAVMSSVADFNVVVISSYPAAQLANVEPYVLPNLSNVPVVVIDNGVTPAFRAEVQAADLSGQFVYVTDATNLNATEQSELATQLSANARTNDLGISVSSTDFKFILVFEAILSMVLIFLGWAYLGSLTSESRSASDLSHLVVVVAAGIFVFFFSESLYLLTSSLLAFPLSLHAVNSGAHITAISLLGFGGGSTPRLAAGFVGVLVGAIAADRGSRFKKGDFALVGGIALILLANPLYLGQLVFQGILLFYPIGSLAFGDAYTGSLTTKGLLYGVGSALGGGLNSTYVLSAGKMLYFAGLVPLAYMKKMGRTTTVIALLVAALIIGDGGVRVGEMTPDKSEIAVLPGLVIGFAFAVVILAIAVVEKYVRGNWKSRA